jgi:hypothetical protein
MISFRVAILLFAVLAITAALTLKGPALYLALIIVGGLTAKTVVHHLRSRLE